MTYSFSSRSGARWLLPARSASAVLVGVLLLSCCSSGQTEVGAPGTALDPTLQLTVEERALLFNTEEELIRRCMSERGFNYTPLPFPREQFVAAAQNGTLWSTGLEPVTPNVNIAEISGYATVASDQAGVAGDSLTEGDTAEEVADSAESRFALNGDPTDDTAVVVELGSDLGSISYDPEGCVFKALVELYGDTRKFMAADNIQGNLGSLLRAEVEQDASYQELTSTWRDCMAEGGFNGFNNQADAYLQGVKLGEAESIALASADAVCLERMGYRDAFRDVTREASARVIGDYEGEIVGLLELRIDALARARALLGEPLPSE